MVKVPKEVIQLVLSIGKNQVVRQCGTDTFDYGAACKIVSIEPFVVSCGERNVLLTRNEDDATNADYEYILLTNKKPIRRNFLANELLFVRWMKHPLFSGISPNEVKESWQGKFLYTKEDIAHNRNGLRSPQLGAIYAFMSKAQNPCSKNIIVMPTGTGKTETMLSILIANQCAKLLVTVPSDALRGQLADKFVSLGVLPKFGIVKNDCKCPYVAIIRETMDLAGWKTVVCQSNVIVTTVSLMTNVSTEIRRLLNDKITHFFVDEAHHSEADTWSEFINSFEDKKVTLFTATPFRNDGKKLQGEFIYTFSLKEAQEQGYYKPIKFIPVREYVTAKADKRIADVAVKQLQEDIKLGFDHILMARCESKPRAKEVFKCYEEYADLNPVVIYSGMPRQGELLSSIKNKKHRIIICVNMLGEGFDLPEMKIAAVHDARQSLPVTLQFVGRFTRTAHDLKLGDASLITNVAYPPLQEELRDLYAKDADWNRLLPIKSDGCTKEEIDFNDFIKSFGNVDDSKISFQNIRTAMSMVIFKTGNTWAPNNWKSVFPDREFDYSYGSVNSEGDTLVIILGRISPIDWGYAETIQNLTWSLIVVHRYCTSKYCHAYINSSDNIDAKPLAKVLFGDTDDVAQLSGPTLFRCFDGVKRFSVSNFGGRKGRQGNISFKSYYGKDVQEGITLTEQSRLSKNNIFGNGYRNGERISIGCSIKGRIWSYMRENLMEFKKWSRMVGQLVEDESIDPNVILRNTLREVVTTKLPDSHPIGIDWNNELYKERCENKIILRCQNVDSHLWSADIMLAPTDNSTHIEFDLCLNDSCSRYRITYGGNEEKSFYTVSQMSGEKIGLIYGNKFIEDICDYFNQEYCAPVVYFADGSVLSANYISMVNDITKPFEVEKLIGLDWTGVNIANESQHVVPYETDSIQYYFSQLIIDDFDILYDDDGSGEIADLLGIIDEADTIHVHLYHLKYAKNGVVSNNILNFYEVCGQAIKCIKWNDKEKGSDLFSRLFARITKKYGERECSRLLKGTETQLEELSKQALCQKSIKLHVSIVQPSLSCQNPSKDILDLLGATASYIKDVANIDLQVYCSK